MKSILFSFLFFSPFVQAQVALFHCRAKDFYAAEREAGGGFVSGPATMRTGETVLTVYEKSPGVFSADFTTTGELPQDVKGAPTEAVTIDAGLRGKKVFETALKYMAAVTGNKDVLTADHYESYQVLRNKPSLKGVEEVPYMIGLKFLKGTAEITNAVMFPEFEIVGRCEK